MASVMSVTGSAASSATIRRGKPRLTLKGQKRKMVKKLLHYLQVVLNKDIAEQMRADDIGYTPLLFTVRPGNAVDKAVGQLVTRCQNLLTAREE